MTVHREIIEWLVTQIPNSEENHYNPHVKIAKKIPDLIVKNADETLREIHEVEVVKINKKLCRKDGAERILWLVIGDSWEKVNVLKVDKKQFDHLTYTRLSLERKQRELDKLIIEQNQLETKLLKSRKALENEIDHLAVARQKTRKELSHLEWDNHLAESIKEEWERFG